MLPQVPNLTLDLATSNSLTGLYYVEQSFKLSNLILPSNYYVYLRNSCVFNDNGPAVVMPREDSSLFIYFDGFWGIRNKYFSALNHSFDKHPSVIRFKTKAEWNGSTFSLNLSQIDYYLFKNPNGEIHNASGPAVVTPEKANYSLYGEQVTLEFFNLINKMVYNVNKKNVLAMIKES